MPENIENWWRRRQLSKGIDVPYAIGAYRGDWERFPVLIRQFHPDLNGFVTLTQIPPAADVYLLWECESGHRFVATPGEQRERPGRSRRRSSWCPECTELALNRHHRRPSATPPDSAASRRAAPAPRVAPAPTAASAPRVARRRRPSLQAAGSPGSAFFSSAAPKPASATEHVASRERSDRRKDRLLREVGWEVIRIRTSKLAPIGPFDLPASRVSDALIDRILDRAGEIRGDLIVAAYERRRIVGERVVPDVGLEPTRP